MLNSCKLYPTQLLEVEELVNIEDLINRLVTVSTPLGDFIGILVGWDRSMHDGIGRLILKNGEHYVIVAKWIVIKDEGQKEN